MHKNQGRTRETRKYSSVVHEPNHVLRKGSIVPPKGKDTITHVLASNKRQVRANVFSPNTKTLLQDTVTNQTSLLMILLHSSYH